MDKLGQNIWKGSKVMAGGLVILWHPDSICLTDWRENNSLIMESFDIIENGVKGTLINVYGPSSYPQRLDFLNFLT